jgi:hypothetical protein
MPNNEGFPYVNVTKKSGSELNFRALLHMNKTVNTMQAGYLNTVHRNLFFYAYLNFKLRLSDFGIVVPEGWSDEITIHIRRLSTNEIKKVSSGKCHK